MYINDKSSAVISIHPLSSLHTRSDHDGGRQFILLFLNLYLRFSEKSLRLTLVYDDAETTPWKKYISTITWMIHRDLSAQILKLLTEVWGKYFIKTFLDVTIHWSIMLDTMNDEVNVMLWSPAVSRPHIGCAGRWTWL